MNNTKYRDLILNLTSVCVQQRKNRVKKIKIKIYPREARGLHILKTNAWHDMTKMFLEVLIGNTGAFDNEQINSREISF